MKYGGRPEVQGNRSHVNNITGIDILSFMLLDRPSTGAIEAYV